MNLRSPSLAGLQPVENGTLGTRVYSELRQFLMVGGLQPGEKVTLRQLTSAFGTSLMPVREAVQRLAAEGALEVLPNRAIRVPIMTKRRIREILAVRLMLEGMAVEAAAERIKAPVLKKLEKLNDAFTREMREHDDSTKLFRINKEFHFTIYRAADMPVLVDVIENMWLRIGPFLHFSLGLHGRAEASKYAPDCHQRLIEALREGDGATGRKALAGDLNGAVDLMMQLGDLPE